MPPPPADLDKRVRDLEELIARVLDRARKHPAGRKILAYLGLT